MRWETVHDNCIWQQSAKCRYQACLVVESPWGIGQTLMLEWAINYVSGTIGRVLGSVVGNALRIRHYRKSPWFCRQCTTYQALLRVFGSIVGDALGICSKKSFGSSVPFVSYGIRHSSRKMTIWQWPKPVPGASTLSPGLHRRSLCMAQMRRPGRRTPRASCRPSELSLLFWRHHHCGCRLYKWSRTCVFSEQLLDAHLGQGLELHWRDSHVCPTEDEYRNICRKSKSSLYRLSLNCPFLSLI